MFTRTILTEKQFVTTLKKKLVFERKKLFPSNDISPKTRVVHMLFNHFIYYILVQGLRVTCLFNGQYNTKGYDTITDVI